MNLIEFKKRMDTTISDYSALTWLNAERPHYAIYLHKVDYCDYCAKVKAAILEKQTTVNRKLQSGNANASEIDQLQKEKELEDKLQGHKEVAGKSLDYYKEMKGRCAEQWKQVTTLENMLDKSSDEEEKLKHLKHSFTLTRLSNAKISTTLGLHSSARLNLLPAETVIRSFWNCRSQGRIISSLYF